ncbi:DUF4105 domain-containing protein [Prevotella copri]|nr:DUF4105 domain-containing protein [Segatella copri]
MKRFKHIFSAILAVILINLTTEVAAQDFSRDKDSDISVQNSRVNEEATAWLDSVDISLLTCGPGQEVWSYYGHTALRIQNKAMGTDVAVNWGMFSFNQSCFVLRFVFGLTDYQIGIYPMSDFIAEYAHEGRWVRQQRLRLSRTEKLGILRSIDKNAQPENRVYRYNFFYDNCTTRAREMILSTDRPISQREWEFLPDNLSKDFATEGRTDFIDASQTTDGKTNTTSDSGYITLVDETSDIIPVQAQITDDTPVTPQMIAIALAIIIIGTTVRECVKKKNYWWFDAILLVLTGLPGLILFTMIFSQHPTVQINFQILILNPLNLIFAWKTVKRMKAGRQYWYFELLGWLLLIALFMQIWQNYAEGMSILALSLLARYCVKSTMMDLSPNNYGLQKHIVKKFRKNK